MKITKRREDEKRNLNDVGMGGGGGPVKSLALDLVSSKMWLRNVMWLGWGGGSVKSLALALNISSCRVS